MITVDEAFRLIHSYKKNWGIEKISLLQTLKRTLAASAFADRDFPPYHRITMDGIAINSAAFNKGKRSFVIEKISVAGAAIATLENAADHCIEVMTGAVLPINCDAVIPYEQCVIDDNMADIKSEKITPFQNIHKQGTDEKKGALLLEKNNRITPACISIMATVGIAEVEVYKLPSVAVCSTGDELVAVKEMPLPHQIRQSNVYFLVADLQKENITASLFHLPDDKENMKQQISSVLQNNDVVLLSGAVSKGRLDYLPQVFDELGMTTIFHGVAQRPGKPFLFGEIGNTLVFGFPGNPVSTFVCYQLFFRQWLYHSFHQSAKIITATLSADVVLASSLCNHILVKIKNKNGRLLAEPIVPSTSGDGSALLHADGIVTFPAGEKKGAKGNLVEVVIF